MTHPGRAILRTAAAACAILPLAALAGEGPDDSAGFVVPWMMLFAWVGMGVVAALALRRGNTGPAKARPEVSSAPRGDFLAGAADTHGLQAAALEAAGDPVSVTDRNGRIVWVNTAFARLTGLPGTDLVGRDLWFATPDPAPLRALLDTVLRTGGTARGESTLNAGNDPAPVYEYTLSPFDGPPGTAGHIVVMQHDVSAQRHAAMELQRAKDDADAANRAKTDTLAVVSHEVRTPLSGILGLTDLALSTAIDSTQREYLDMIRSSAGVMLGVINDILDLSRIEAGRLELESAPLALHACLETALAPLRVRVDRKGLQLTCAVDPCVPDRLVGDAQRLEQVLVNLVANAIKFTDHGGVHVAVALAGTADASRVAEETVPPSSEDAAGPSVILHVSVSDTGIGIPAEQQERIFDAFEQGDASRARCAGGTGLGLAIATRLVRKMGGWMWVESEVGRGSTFHCTMHLGVQAAEAGVLGLQPHLDREEHAPAPTGPGAGAPVRRLRVLVGEDDPIHERLIVAILQQRGHTVTVAHTGTEVVRRFDTEPIDVVLMDVRMPEMDGLTATAELRKREIRRLTLDTPPSALRHAHIPIIAMTAGAMPQDRERCLAAGMDDYLTKPCGPTALIAAIEAADRCGHPSTAVATDAHPPLSAAAVDRDLLMEQIDGNIRLLRELARLFDERSPRLLAGIRNAIAAGNAEDLQLVAHTLKGTFGNLAAPTGRATADAVETAAARGDFEAAAAAIPTLETEVTRVAFALAAILNECHAAAA